MKKVLLQQLSTLFENLLMKKHELIEVKKNSAKLYKLMALNAKMSNLRDQIKKVRRKLGFEKQ